MWARTALVISRWCEKLPDQVGLGLDAASVVLRLQFCARSLRQSCYGERREKTKISRFHVCSGVEHRALRVHWNHFALGRLYAVVKVRCILN